MLPRRLPFAITVRGARDGQTERACASQRAREARQSERAFAVPLRGRPAQIPCLRSHDIDFSAKSLRSGSHREYAIGEELPNQVRGLHSATVARNGEFSSKVVRVAPAGPTRLRSMSASAV